MDWPTGLRVEPLGTWPGALATRRERSRFDSTMSSTMETLRRELAALGARDTALQVAIPASQFRLDGYPRATARAEHPGVILTLQSKHGPLSYPCDTFDRWEDNLRAIALALEALRKVDRYGVTRRGEQYRGFLAIEGATAAPAGFATADDAWSFLSKIVEGYSDDLNPTTAALVLRHAKRRTHPDMAGGDAATFQRVTLAEAKLRAEGML